MHKTKAFILTIAAVLLTCAFQAGQAPQIPSSHLISTDNLVKILQSPKGEKPLIIHVGFHVLYLQAHIPGAEYIGPASDPSALRKLRTRAESLPKNKLIVIYCGCCPWVHCPTVKAADDAFLAMGFTNVKVLHIPDNFGTDWRDKGHPTAKGE